MVNHELVISAYLHTFFTATIHHQFRTTDLGPFVAY